MNFRPGVRFITIFTVGHIMEHGNIFIICCARGCAKEVGATNTQRQVAWTAKASNVLRYLDNEVLMLATRSMAVNATFCVDTLGLLLAVVVTVASVQDRDGARLLLRQLPGYCKKLRKI